MAEIHEMKDKRKVFSSGNIAFNERGPFVSLPLAPGGISVAGKIDEAERTRDTLDEKKIDAPGFSRGSGYTGETNADKTVDEA